MWTEGSNCLPPDAIMNVQRRGENVQLRLDYGASSGLSPCQLQKTFHLHINSSKISTQIHLKTLNRVVQKNMD